MTAAGFFPAASTSPRLNCCRIELTDTSGPWKFGYIGTKLLHFLPHQKAPLAIGAGAVELCDPTCAGIDKNSGYEIRLYGCIRILFRTVPSHLENFFGPSRTVSNFFSGLSRAVPKKISNRPGSSRCKMCCLPLLVASVYWGLMLVVSVTSLFS